MGELKNAGAALSELLELTPRQVWFLYDCLQRTEARHRAFFVADVTTALCALSKEGQPVVREAIAGLLAVAGAR